MSESTLFQKNLQKLAGYNPALCQKLAAATPCPSRYRLLQSRSGELIPALIDADGITRPLHSTVDPRREAERLIAGMTDASHDQTFLVFLGLGAGFAVEAALQSNTVSQVIVIDYDLDGIAQLFGSIDFAKILGDPRVTIAIDPEPGQIESLVLGQYLPALSGGIKVIPLRARTERDAPRFNAAFDAIQRAIEKVSADYSVQAYFGTRWFSNIIRNLRMLDQKTPACYAIPPDMKGRKDAAICAAGPSLDIQINELAQKKQKQRDLLIIAADTALPALLACGIKPDAVVSIDCQHISCYHFIGAECRNIPLFLDIASPPLLSGFSDKPIFFSGGHPLAHYVSHNVSFLPTLDTSGGNVTYACLSLAESLGVQRIFIYGADFSYPQGRVYARGTYIYPFFERKQNRLRPFEAQFSAFLYRSPFVPPETFAANQNCIYETASLRSYRKSFEAKASSLNAQVIPQPGMGVPIHINNEKTKTIKGTSLDIVSLPDKINSVEFLKRYQNSIQSLPQLNGPCSLHKLNDDEKQILSTLLPLMAAIKRRNPALTACQVLEETKHYCVSQIGRVVSG